MKSSWTWPRNLLLPLLLDESGEVKVDSADAEVQQSSKKALNLFKYLVQKIQAWFQLLKEVEESSTNAVTTAQLR